MVGEEEPPLPPGVHHPDGGAPHRFDEQTVRELVLEWQRDQKPELLNEILSHSEPVITGVVLSRSSSLEDLDEMLSLLRIRVCRKLAGYDPSRGRIFTYLTLVVQQGFIDTWSKRALYAQRYKVADLSTLDHLAYSAGAAISRAEVYEDIRHRIMQVRTICTDEHELSAQRWLVRGLLDSEFKLRRHQAADSMRIVYGLDWTRSRRLHDLTVLETRRQLLPLLEIPHTGVAQLVGTRGQALAKYAGQLSPGDFSKLAYLMRGLAPAIIEAGRIDWILDGYPGAHLLFNGDIEQALSTRFGSMVAV